MPQLIVAPPTPDAETRLQKMLGVPSFIARLAYFLVVPCLLVVFAAYLPLTGALANLGLLLTYFLLSPYLRRHLEARPRLAKALAKFTRFEAYYREHPPRAFIYYALYPLLFPYWLIARRGRREFLLYRSMGVVALLVIVGGGALQFFGQWYPEISFLPFLKVYVFCFVAQVICTLAFMLPIATTTVAYQLGGKKRRLLALYVVGVLSAAITIAVAVTKRHDILPVTTRARLVLRFEAEPARARAAFRAALDATRDTHAKSETFTDVPGGREIRGPRLDAARAALAKFWREDEAEAFDFAAVFDADGKPVFVLFVLDSKGRPVMLGGFDAAGDLPLPVLLERLGPKGLEVLARIRKK